MLVELQEKCLVFLSYVYDIIIGLFYSQHSQDSPNEIQDYPSQTTKDDSWVRPLGYVERFMTLAGHYGNMSTVYSLSLESTVPISFEIIRETSQMMFKKMPHLRLCIKSRRGVTWWKKMEFDHLDIKEEEQTDGYVTRIFESLLKKKYNTEDGPLWFVRFISTRKKTFSEAGLNLSYKYVCMFGFHHNFSDGTTNMNFCRIFLSLLNDTLRGDNTSHNIENEENGRFAYPIQDDLAKAEISYLYLLKVMIIRLFRIIVCYSLYVSNFITCYPMTYNKRGCTLVLQTELDENTTSNLLKRCKMEGVTLNTAFTAAANIGLHRMILQHDGKVSETTFNSRQTINMRRYWPKEKRKHSYGCHIFLVDIEVPCKQKDFMNFWEYARQIHQTIYNELETGNRTLKVVPLSERLGIPIFINYWASKFLLPSANDGHYCITNMGDVSSIFSGHGDVVLINKIFRSVSCHFMPTLCQHTIHTFRGRFCHSLDYYPQKMSLTTAEMYTSSLMDTLKTAICMPN